MPDSFVTVRWREKSLVDLHVGATCSRSMRFPQKGMPMHNRLSADLDSCAIRQGHLAMWFVASGCSFVARGSSLM